MIDYISQATLKKLYSNNFIKEEEFAIYQYGLELFIATILKAVGLMVISITLGLVKEAIIFIFCFSGLRINAGGYHAKTFWKCFVMTLCLIFIGIYVAKIIPVERQHVYILVSIMISILLIYIYAPMESENKPLSEEEEIEYGYKSLLTIIIGSIIVLFLIYIYPSFIYLGTIAVTAFLMESLTLIHIPVKTK